jgi:hypothetical protein
VHLRASDQELIYYIIDNKQRYGAFNATWAVAGIAMERLNNWAFNLTLTNAAGSGADAHGLDDGDRGACREPHPRANDESVARLAAAHDTLSA